MKKRRIRVDWPNGSTSFYESISTCAKSLGIANMSVYNYLHGGTIPMGIKFSYSDMTGEEELLRQVMQINPVVRIDE